METIIATIKLIQKSNYSVKSNKKEGILLGHLLILRIFTESKTLDLYKNRKDILKRVVSRQLSCAKITSTNRFYPIFVEQMCD